MQRYTLVGERTLVRFLVTIPLSRWLENSCREVYEFVLTRVAVSRTVVSSPPNLSFLNLAYVLC